MSPRKLVCKCHVPPCKKPRRSEVDEGCEMHPSLAAGLEALEDYSHWVNAIVLPIAFQWIEEHKAQVYADVPQDLRDDIGVAIAAAFRIVKELPTYKQGREECEAYDSLRAKGEVDPSKINPVWTRITNRMREKTREAFAEDSEHLGETIP